MATSASLVETVISVLKRQYGDAVSSRVWWRQFRELVAICLVYNVERAVKRGVSLIDLFWSRLLYSLPWRISTEPSLLDELSGELIMHLAALALRRAVRNSVQAMEAYGVQELPTVIFRRH